MVNRRGLLLLLLLRDVSLKLGPLTFGVLNARSIRNKGPLLADIVASNDLDFPCLMETHIRHIHISVPVENFQPWLIEEGYCCYCY